MKEVGVKTSIYITVKATIIISKFIQTDLRANRNVVELEYTYPRIQN